MSERAIDSPTSSALAGRIGLERTLTLVARLREVGIVIVLLVVVAIVTVQAPLFFSISNFEQILLNVSLIAIVAVGQTTVVLTRNVDLSVGSVVGLVAFATGDLLKEHTLGVASAIAVGCLIGLGLLVAVAKVPAIVATLGTLYVYRGLDFLIAGGKQVSAIDLPRGYLGIASSTLLGVPTLILAAALIALGAAYLLRNSGAGRQLYAIGSNPTAAEVVGIPTQRLIFGAFVVCGLCAGIAGVLWGSRFGSVNALAASGLELQVIAAVVVGGVNIFGGSGTVVGAVLGAILLATIENALRILHLSEFWLLAIDGAIILLAVGTDAAIRGYFQRILMRTGRR
ncbi:MAG: ABC transporter permease [Chloroflexi bacterium]|nr:MAG: ABC transporter permease [Chloroflexota bacterium]